MARSFIFTVMLFSALLFSCHQNINKEQTTVNTPNNDSAAVIKHPQSNSNNTNDGKIDWDTIQYDNTYIPGDTNFITKVLTASSFHSDEVWQDADKAKWWGLFKAASGYYLSETAITTTRQNDPIVDADSTIKTGWLVQANYIDTTVILFTDLPDLKSHKVQQVDLKHNYIWPGDTVTFRYNNAEYTLYATGGKFHDKSYGDQNWYDVWNYKLYLSTIKDGMIISQLIVAAPHYKATMAQIDFIGDIDSDGIPDMIINTTVHYNATIPTLYLSRFADKNGLLKIVGLHLSVGC